MQAQGWLNSILRWTKSFLENRRVQVRSQGGVIEVRELIHSVPKGSPISPLIFLLYMAELIKSRNALTRSSYADDIGILDTGRTVEESAAAASSLRK